MKAVDGTVHGFAAMGASAASGALLSEEWSAARDVSGTTNKALKKRAAAVFRTNAVQEAFQAAMLIEDLESFQDSEIRKFKVGPTLVAVRTKGGSNPQQVAVVIRSLFLEIPWNSFLEFQGISF